MHIDKLSYSQSHETLSSIGLRTWYKFEAGGTVDQGENMEEAVATLKKFVQENVFPDLGMANEYIGKGLTERLIPIPDTKEVWANQMIKEIEECTRISHISQFGKETELLAYESAANSDPRIKAAYDLKMIQLKQKK